MADPVLWQFKYSHYNEKARWALDFNSFGGCSRNPCAAAFALIHLYSQN